MNIPVISTVFQFLLNVMNVKTLAIIIVILILIPIIMERVEFSFSDLLSNPKDSCLKFLQDVFDFYKNSIGNWISGVINNIIEEKIKGKKIEIELK